MKIIQALGWYFPDGRAGTEIYVQSLSKELVRAGHEVEIVAPETGISEPRRYIHEGLEVYRYPSPLQPTLDEARGRRSTAGARSLREMLADRRPDVFHVHTLTTGLGALELEAAAAGGATTIVTNHLPSLGYLCARGSQMQWGDTPCDGLCIPTKCAACVLTSRGIPRIVARTIASAGPLASKLMTPLAPVLPQRILTAARMGALIEEDLRQQRRVMESVDRFVVLNQWSLDRVLDNGAPPERVTLNRLGVRSLPPRIQRPPTQPPVRIGFLGRLSTEKGIGDLIRAIRALPDQLPVAFALHGLPAQDEAGKRIAGALQRLAASDSRVAVLPPVESSAVPALLRNLDVLCVPSVVYEGGPTVMYEAHAEGTPVIATGIGTPPEVITDGLNGRLYPPGDADELAQIFAEVASNPGVVDEWRSELPSPRTIRTIAGEYLAVYCAPKPTSGISAAGVDQDLL